jgi:hypothetical protein
MHFSMKSTLKNSRNHTLKRTLNIKLQVGHVNLVKFKITLF